MSIGFNKNTAKFFKLSHESLAVIFSKIFVVNPDFIHITQKQK